MNLSIGEGKSSSGPKRADSVISTVDSLLWRAIECGASDVHFEPTSSDLAVKYRLDGVLKEVEKLPKAIAENVIARLKVLGELLTYRNDIPQEGRIEINRSANGVADERLAIFPTIYGQRAVVRIFYQNSELSELEQLGFGEQIYRTLRQLAAQSQGVVLVTGPAGSGKSTTLAAVLRHIQKTYPGKSIVTCEDPVEIRIDGVTQVQITPYGELTFSTALRSLLRQDPQVLMIGEIRDAETARIVVEAGLTGHFLMSTMHSGTPAGALLRLLEMGIEPYQVTSSVSAVLNQRLVRKLCAKCKRQNDKGAYEAVGCDECLGTGFKGRMLIAEIVRLDSDLRRAILEKSDHEQLEASLLSKGHLDMYENGRHLVEQGLTTQRELEQVCGVFEAGEW